MSRLLITIEVLTHYRSRCNKMRFTASAADRTMITVMKMGNLLSG